MALAVAALALGGCSDGGDDEDGGRAHHRGGDERDTGTVTESVVTAERAPDTSGSLADAVARVLPSVVSVRTKFVRRRRGRGLGSDPRPRRPDRDRTTTSSRGRRASRFRSMTSASTREGVYRNGDGTEPERDLAVIRVQVRRPRARCGLARSSALRLGDSVIAIGFPLGLGGPTVTSGIVSGLNRTIDGRNGDADRPAPDGRRDQPRQLGRAARRSRRTARRNQHRGRTRGQRREHRLRDLDRRCAAGDRPDPPGRHRARRTWLGIAYSSVDSESAAVQLGLDSSTRGAAVTVVYPGGPGARRPTSPSAT